MGGTPILGLPGQPGPMKPGEFEAASIPNIVTFQFEKVGPPSPIYVQRDDTLFLSVSSSIVDTVTMNVRLLLAPFLQAGQPSDGPSRSGKIISQGVIQPLQLVVTNTPGVAYGTTTGQRVLTEGYLLSVGATCANAIRRGQTFVRASIFRNAPFSAAPPSFVTLFSDYLTVGNPQGWPGGRISDSTDGTGNIFLITVANPAAGVDWTTTFNINARDRIISANAQLATSAAVANRFVRSQIVASAGQVVFQGGPTIAIPASTTAQVSLYPDALSLAPDVTTVAVALPGQPTIGSGSAANGAGLRVNTLNLQGADQWSAIQILVEEWIDNL